MIEHKILVVDDDKLLLETITKLLKKEGYSVTSVDNGYAAIEKAKQSFHDLIILDVKMPDIDGIEVLKKIRKLQKEDAQSVVIIITGYASEDVPIKAIRFGVSDYILKPFELSDFLYSVNRNMRICRLEKDKRKYILEISKMNEELKQAKEKIEDYSKTLEQKVEERTKQLREAQIQLVQSAKMSSVGQFGAGVAHELNNPIGGIFGYAQFILQKLSRPDFTPKDFKACEKYVKYIENESKRCKVIVENLLSFSRKSTAALEPLDIKQPIKNTLSVMSYQLELQNIKVTTDYEPDLPPISGNVNQLQQVFTNIILNAQQAMSKGGKLDIRVTIDVQGGKKNLKIYFKDTGSGIPKQNLEKIFEPFFSTKQDWKSIGIGLSMTYQIIKEHNGRITVESQVGKGTTVTITLPASPE